MATPFYQDRDTFEYLCGHKLSTGMIFPFPCKKNIISRVDYIEKKCLNKRIIHVGCLDHIEVLEKKIKSNTWLHQRITSASEKCIGVDINEEGINVCKDKYGIDNIFYADITQKIPEEISQEKFDILLLSDVIEHIPNPASFLSAIHKNFSSHVSKMLITTPYAFRSVNLIKALKNEEFINTDHCFWFTPYTLSKLLVMSGYQIKNIDFVEPENHRIARIFGRLSFCYDVFAVEVEF